MGGIPANWLEAACTLDLAGVALWVTILHFYTQAIEDVKDAAQV